MTFCYVPLKDDVNLLDFMQGKIKSTGERFDMSGAEEPTCLHPWSKVSSLKLISAAAC